MSPAVRPRRHQLRTARVSASVSSKKLSPAISLWKRRLPAHSGSRECQLIYRGSGAREPPDRCKLRGSRASLSRWIPLDRSSSPWHRAHGFEPCRRRATPRFVPFGHRSSRHPSLNRGVYRITQLRRAGIQPITVNSSCPRIHDTGRAPDPRPRAVPTSSEPALCPLGAIGYKRRTL